MPKKIKESFDELDGLSGDELLEATVSLDYLLDFFEMSKSTLYKLASEGWIPKPVDGKWHWFGCAKGVYNYQRAMIIQKYTERRY